MIKITLLFLILFLLYEKIRRPVICKKKIYKHITDIGGEVINIERISHRDEIFSVHYKIGSDSKTATVKFDFFYSATWA